MEQRHSESVIRQLAQKLLSEQENKQFKQSIHEFQKTNSLTTLCSQLEDIINTPERLVLLVELSYLVPSHLSNDFHRICSLQFSNYGKALQTCRPGTLPRHESSRIIAQDSSGKSRIVSQGNFKRLVINSSPDLRHSSRISQNSNGSRSFDDQDESTSGFDSFWDTSLSPGSRRKFDSSLSTNATSGKMSEPIYARSKSLGYEQTNGYVGRKNEITIYEDNMGLSITKIPESSNFSTINRKKALRRVYILRKQGNLGLSLKGGRDDKTPVTIDWVEEGSLAHQQGLKAGDRILEVNGHDFSRISHDAAVRIMLMSSELGLLVETDETENGRFDVFNRYDSREEDIIIYPTPQGRIGCAITRDGLSGHEMIVKGIEANSPASKAGLNIGDYVLKIDGIDVNLLTEKQVVSLATSSKKVKLRIGRAPYFPLRNSGERKLRPFGSETHYLPYESYAPLNRVYSFGCLSPTRSNEHGPHNYHSYQRQNSAHVLGTYPQSHTGYRKIIASSRSGPVLMSKASRQHATAHHHSTTYLRSISNRLEDLHLSGGHYESRSARSVPSGRLYQSKSAGAINFLSDCEDSNRKTKYGYMKNHRVTSGSSSPNYYMSDSDSSWHLY